MTTGLIVSLTLLVVVVLAVSAMLFRHAVKLGRALYRKPLPRRMTEKRMDEIELAANRWRAAGRCPACGREFLVLAEHMPFRHPDYVGRLR